MHIGELAFNKLFSHLLYLPKVQCLKETFKLGCLLHDIGHAPLSHTTESVMPKLHDLQLPDYYKKSNLNFDRQATHEDYTLKIITDSQLTEDFDQIIEEFGVNPFAVADLILGETLIPEYFIVDGIDYFPLLHQLISSEMDCDRMDYLLRDSYYCGVSYGNYDLDWLIDNFEVCLVEDRAYLGISERAVVTFDDFLLSRFHMFLMVYFHYRSVCLEKLLKRYFDTNPQEYSLPADIDEYCEHDDHVLMKCLRSSTSSYAQAIVTNTIPPKIYESFNTRQYQQLKKIEKFLEQNNIEYIKSDSKGRLSKYYGHQQEIFNETIKVVRRQGETTSFININEATDLFEKFSKSHHVSRLYCDIDQLNFNLQQQLNILLKK
jgi:HD superfamily phosphohydrolase